ncbi:MAG: alpha-ketoglutarate-dependent dioxygenase AlkB [Pseudomonadota bacterium]
MNHPTDLRGVTLYPSCLDQGEQAELVADVRAVVAKAPLFSPETRWGKKMSVRMTSAGAFGWVSDRRGYRYEPAHPKGEPWPPIPDSILKIWHRLSGLDRAPDCCLINWYGEGARMGLHQDRDEADFSFPVVSISLGDDGLFRVGSVERGGKTGSHWLKSGDVCVLAGDARLIHHGVDRIRFGSSTLLKSGGRLNLTLRVVT